VDNVTINDDFALVDVGVVVEDSVVPFASVVSEPLPQHCYLLH
jgi:hypothetical protein